MKALRHAGAFLGMGLVYGLCGAGLGQALWVRLSQQAQNWTVLFSMGLVWGIGLFLPLFVGALILANAYRGIRKQRARRREAMHELKPHHINSILQKP